MSWPVFVEPPPEAVIGPLPELLDEHNPPKFKNKEFKDYQYCKLNKLQQQISPQLLELVKRIRALCFSFFCLVLFLPRVLCCQKASLSCGNCRSLKIILGFSGKPVKWEDQVIRAIYLSHGEDEAGAAGLFSRYQTEFFTKPISTAIQSCMEPSPHLRELRKEYKLCRPQQNQCNRA